MSEEQSISREPSVASLFTPRQIYAASFIGSPIAAAWFISRNLAVLSGEKNQSKVILAGVGATALVMVVAFLLPDKFPNMVLPIAYSAATYYYANSLFGRDVQAHLESGGRRGSWWRVIGMSSLWLLAVVAVLFLAVFVLPESWFQ